MAKSASKCVVLIAAMVMVLSGCGSRAGDGRLAVGPDMDALATPPDFAMAAIEACGGTKAWTAARHFDLDCVTSLLQQDGSQYLTELHCAIYPWSRSIQISGSEPGGDFLWQLRSGEFSARQGGAEIDRITEQVVAPAIARAVLTATIAPALLLDGRVEFTQMAAPVKLDGRWYSVITRTLKPELTGTARIPEVVFYQRRDTSVVDRVLVAAGEKVLVVNSYAYHETTRGGPLVPARLEVHEANDRGLPLRRLIKIDLK